MQITVLSPPGSHAELEQRLEQKFELHEVIVTEVDSSASQEAVSRQIGGVVADYLRRVVGIAGGLEKFRAVYGALHGGLVNVLITDSALAAELIERDYIEERVK